MFYLLSKLVTTQQSRDAPASPGLHVTWLGAREPRYARGATPDKHVRHEKKSVAQIEVGVELQTLGCEAMKLQLSATPRVLIHQVAAHHAPVCEWSCSLSPWCRESSSGLSP